MNLKVCFTIFFVLCIHFLWAQNTSIILLDSSKNTSLRGLSVVNNKIVWCSGSNGTVGKSIDGGKCFTWLIINGFEKRDFRDIEAFDAQTAIIMAVGEPAVILKTKDGGRVWEKVFVDSRKGMFLDAMSFDKNGHGVVVGDPIGGYMFQAYTKDFGDSWIASTACSVANGEAFFASSGTNIQHQVKNRIPYAWVSGGSQSRIFIGGKYYRVPMAMGKESTGANSIAVWKKRAVIVGGDFANDQRRDSNCVLVKLGKGTKSYFPKTAPLGYRSCVMYYHKNKLFSCGTSGVDVSNDGGNTWQNLSTQSFHVIQKAKKGNAVFMAGSKGRIALMRL